MKKRGVHSVPVSFLSFSFALCLSSISCFSCVALPYCLFLMACVTAFQKRKDSFGSWDVRGGVIFGAGSKAVRSMRRTCVYNAISKSSRCNNSISHTLKSGANETNIFSFQFPPIFARISSCGTCLICVLSSFSGSYLKMTPSILFCAFPSQPSSW